MNIYHDLATAVRRAPGYDPAAALLERAFAHKDGEIKRLRALTAWQPIETAPKDECILAVVDDEVRMVCWCKASHVPLYGWCLADQGDSDVDLCKPTHWLPLPAPPDPAEPSVPAKPLGG